MSLSQPDKLKKLSGKQISALRSVGQTTKPTVYIGKSGVTDTVVQSIEDGFNTQELLKIRVLEGSPEDKKEVAGIVSKKSGSTVIQIIGNTILIFRPRKS